MRAALAIHPGALGDVLQAVPALRALGAEARVSFCGQPRLAALLTGTDVVAEALSFDGFGLEALFTAEPAPELAHRLAAFDRVVSWFGSRDDGYPARLRSLVHRADRARHDVVSCVVAPPVPDGPIPVWRHLLATLRPSGEPRERGPRAITEPDASEPASTGRSGVLVAAADDAERAERVPCGDPGAPPGCGSGAWLRQPLAVPEDWRQAGRRALAALGIPGADGFLVVHPGAGGRAKLLAPAMLAAAVARATRPRPTSAPAAGTRTSAAPARPAVDAQAAATTHARNVHVLVHQGPADREPVERLVALLDGPAPILLEPSLPLLAGVLSVASAYLGGDSGVSHLAAAVGAPSAIVFPAGTRARWRPWSQTARVIAAERDDDDVAREAAETLREMLDAGAGGR